MNPRELLSLVRYEPIDNYPCSPDQIPCVETSDSARLCKNPVVSVCMITYNHEPYIREAIESVMAQQTDFEFELVIGEDCSSDRTREICLEYQRKYPDKIRVLWAHVNVYKSGGNGRRVRARCRGEYIAFCEGDDYWCDPRKLQRQVEVMRNNPRVTTIFTRARVYLQEQQSFRDHVYDDCHRGLYSGMQLFRELSLVRMFGKERFDPELIRTPTAMIRKSVRESSEREYEIFSWRLRLSDTSQWLACALKGDVYFMPETTAVYRKHSGGVTHYDYAPLMRDATVVKMYFLLMAGASFNLLCDYFRDEIFDNALKMLVAMTGCEQRSYYRKLCCNEVVHKAFRGCSRLPYRLLLWHGGLTTRLYTFLLHVFIRVPRRHVASECVIVNSVMGVSCE